MRVGLLTHSVTGGGAQQVARVWGAALAGAGHDVTMLVLDEPAPDHPTQQPVEHPWRTIHLLAEGVSSIPQRVRWLRPRLQRDFDAVIAVQTYPNLLLLIARAGLSKAAYAVISEHNIPSIYLRDSGAAYRAQLALAHRFYRGADHAIAVSHAVATDLIGALEVPIDRCSVVLNGVLADDAAPAPQLETPKSVTLLVPARVAKQKRPWKAVSVAEALARRGVDVRLRWVGDESPDLVGYAFPTSTTVTIERLPWNPDWKSLADESTVVLLPSGVEGLANVLVESAAAGIVCVAGSTSLGVGDSVVPGVTGAFARSDDDEDWADAVVEALAIKRGAGVDAWLAGFTTAATSRALERILSRASHTR